MREADTTRTAEENPKNGARAGLGRELVPTIPNQFVTACRSGTSQPTNPDAKNSFIVMIY